MRINPSLLPGLLLVAVVMPAFAQTEAGVVVSGAFSSQPNLIAIGITCPIGGCGPSPLPVDNGVAVEGFLAHSVANFRVASLSFELPVTVIPDRGTKFTGATFSTLAITPDLRVSLVPKASISPFLSGGGGFVHFSGDTSSANKGAVAVGAGVDFKTRVPLLGVRVQAKDLITPWPFLPFKSGVMNNVLVGGGLILRF